jgi:pimeloyl-ACP methyl ester carboxylesterase
MEAHAEKAIGEHTLSLSLRRTSSPPFRREEVEFTSGDTRLVGALVVPPGEGPHPAVVLLHGSGRQGMHKWEYRSWADLLARQGLAVLYYDKRGVGSSGGEYGSSLRQLALDGIAAVRYLRTRPEMDPGRVGLWGLSEGAWVAEQVAADLGDMAFLLLVSGAASTPRDQDFQKLEYGMRSDGLPEEQIEDALAYAGLYFYVARTGEGWALLEAATKRAQREPWGQYVDQPRSQGDLAWWHENHAFQPASVVAGLDLPVLLLYGEEDWITPPVENGQKLKSLFPSPDKVELHVFEGADHRLEIPSGLDGKGRWQWPRNGAAMHRTVVDWLRKHGLK